MFGEQLCKSPEEFKAWSQNLGHEKVLTTFYSYGEVQPQRQAEIIKNLEQTKVRQDSDIDKLVEKVINRLASVNN